MKRAVLAAALTILSLSTAYADDCMDKAASQADMNECAQKSYATADAMLNKLYRQIQQRLGNDAGAKQRLVAAQRVWVAFRDAECRFSAFDSESGSQYSAFPLAYNECLENLTTKRIGDFKSYLTCGDKDDVKCPVPAGK
jgi:uncharacterized protein YecT (DUF1311 family)